MSRGRGRRRDGLLGGGSVVWITMATRRGLRGGGGSVRRQDHRREFWQRGVIWIGDFGIGDLGGVGELGGIRIGEIDGELGGFLRQCFADGRSRGRLAAFVVFMVALALGGSQGFVAKRGDRSVMGRAWIRRRFVPELGTLVQGDRAGNGGLVFLGSQEGEHGVLNDDGRLRDDQRIAGISGMDVDDGVFNRFDPFFHR